MIPARCSYLTDTYGITAVTDASEAIKAADMVLVPGVNPPQISSVTSILKTILRLDTIVLSYACGVAISVFEEQLGSDKKSCASCLTPSVSLATGIRWLTVMKTSARTIKLSSTSCSRALEGPLYGESKFDSFQGYGCTRTALGIQIYRSDD